MGAAKLPSRPDEVVLVVLLGGAEKLRRVAGDEGVTEGNIFCEPVMLRDLRDREMDGSRGSVVADSAARFTLPVTGHQRKAIAH